MAKLGTIDETGERESMLDLLVMILTNKPSTREVILFPQLKEKP
jgi:aspartyl-tRNA synthetase